MNSEFKDILETVTENGRVLGNGDGTFDFDSLEVEVEFEASERGLSADDTAAAVAWALAHADAR